MYPPSTCNSQLTADLVAYNADLCASILGLFQSKSQTTYYFTYNYFSKNLKLLIGCKLVSTTCKKELATGWDRGEAEAL